MALPNSRIPDTSVSHRKNGRTHELHFGTFQFRETNSHIRVVRLQSLGKEGSKKGGGEGGIPWAFRRHAFENARDLQYFKSR